MKCGHKVGLGGGGEINAFKVPQSAQTSCLGVSRKRENTGRQERLTRFMRGMSERPGIAIPMAYDLGGQRNAWIGQVITNWMGDDGFLKTLYCEYRRFNVYGDIQWIKGKVAKKYEQNGEHLVDLDVWSENQRGEVTAPEKQP